MSLTDDYYSPGRIAALVLAAVEHTTAGALTYTVQIAGKAVRLTVDVVGEAPVLILCPGCDLRLPEDDLVTQRHHLTTAHPEIVTGRQMEVARWDGWVC